MGSRYIFCGNLEFIDANNYKFRGSENKIFEAFSVAIDNAIFWHSGNEKIIIRSEKNKNKKFINLLVLDRGPGISKNDKRNVFKQNFSKSGSASPSKLNDGSVLVDGTMTVRDINRFMDWKIPDDEASTLAGLFIEKAQKLPKEGEILRIKDYKFKVIKRNKTRISKLSIIKTIND